MKLYVLPTELDWSYNVFDESYTAKILVGELVVEPFSKRRWKFSVFSAADERDAVWAHGVIEDGIDTYQEAMHKALEWYRTRLSQSLRLATEEEILEAAYEIQKAAKAKLAEVTRDALTGFFRKDQQSPAQGKDEG